MIHLRRDTWAQTMSLVKARETSVYALESARYVPETLVIPEERFVTFLAYNERMLAFEDEIMSHLPHLRVQYETDLLEASRTSPASMASVPISAPRPGRSWRAGSA